jgi:hypothetical protein
LQPVICNTSPIQYLHQLGHLDLLRALASDIRVPCSVASEIDRGISLGVDLPSLTSLPWIGVHAVQSCVHQNWINKLGLGEAEVLQLALETPGSLVVLDDRVARRIADSHKLPIKGTIGLLLDAKNAGLVTAIGPLLDRLDKLGFRLSTATRLAALHLAGEPAS